MAKENIEAMVVLGRGIGKSRQGNWWPTHYFERLEADQHSGSLEDCPDPANPDTVIGGGNANTLAAYYLYERLMLEGYPPGLIIFAAGRARYLEAEAPEISEGAVMKDKLFRRLVGAQTNLPEAIVLTDNKNTKDDIVESLRILKQRGINRAAVITVGVHLPRTAEFVKLARQELGIEDIELDLVSAEEVLRNVDSRFGLIFDQARESDVYKRTQAKEQQGIEALKQGNYDAASQGYEFAKNT